MKEKKNLRKNKIESISYHLKNKKKDNSLVQINNNLVNKIIKKIKNKKIKVKRVRHSLDFAYGPTREDIIIYK